MCVYIYIYIYIYSLYIYIYNWYLPRCRLCRDSRVSKLLSAPSSDELSRLKKEPKGASKLLSYDNDDI